jgi:hypothetical protein
MLRVDSRDRLLSDVVIVCASLWSNIRLCQSVTRAIARVKYNFCRIFKRKRLPLQAAVGENGVSAEGEQQALCGALRMTAAVNPCLLSTLDVSVLLHEKMRRALIGG